MQKCRAWAICTLVLFIPCLSSCVSQGAFDRSDGAQRESVVVLHGLGRTTGSMWLLASRIEAAGFDVIRIGYDSLNASPDQILEQVSHQIDACCADRAGAVHFVGHSLGGLVIRAYLARHRPRSLGRVVLIATPNAGTPLVDTYRDTWWMGLAGPTAQRLGTDSDSFPNSLPAPDYPVGVIAGVTDVPWMKDQIEGLGDGIVPLESSQIAGMVDYVLVGSTHSGLRYDPEVARQTIAFLREGRFAQNPE